MPTTTIILAMAGPAEAAEFFGLMIGWALLAVLCVLTLVAVRFWTKRIGIILSAIAFILVWCSALLFQPWQAFVPLTNEDLADPDVIAWVSDGKVFAVAWALVAMLVIAGVIFVWGRNRCWRAA